MRDHKYNSNLLPKGYFSRSSVPYWCIVALDCIVLVLAGVIALYVVYGGVGIVSNFWESVKIWAIALPIFLLYMHLFRTYVGTLLDSPLKMLSRLACAQVAGGVTLGLGLLLLPSSLFDYMPGLQTVGLAVLMSLLVQWGLRMVAKYIFKGHEHESADRIFFRTLNMGDYSDTSIRAKKKINLCLAHMSEEGEEMKYVKEAFDTNWVVPLGPNVNAFEQDLEKFVNPVQVRSEEFGMRSESKVVALSAGTAAVHLALRACDVLPGDEVIVQSFTFCASANPVAYIGALPVFVDSEPLTWNMDPALLEEAIKDRIAKTGRKPKAIIPVALYGMPYQVDKIMEVANRYEIPVIEDAAEGFGSRYKGRVLGTFGRYGVLSFNGNKMITTSGGGALVCNGVRSEELGVRSVSAEQQAKNILWYATQARESYPYYQHEAIGYNYRLSNVSAGIGRGQMTVVDDHIAHHKHVQALYDELFKDVPGIKLHKQPTNEELGVKGEELIYDSNYWLCAITLNPSLKIKGQENAYKTVVKGAVGGAAGVVHMTDSPTTDCQPNDNVEALRVWMDEHQVEARPLWKPMHKQPVFRTAPAYVNGVSESLFKVGMCLPAGPMVSDEDVHYIVKCIKDAIEN